MSNKPMVYSTLCIYSWSLFQFTLNLVVTRGNFLVDFNTIIKINEIYSKQEDQVVVPNL